MASTRSGRIRLRRAPRAAAHGLARGLDRRTGLARPVRRALNLLFPDHWSFMLGEIALYSFLVLVLTGVYLTFFFDPSMEQVRYHGRYVPLDGVQMSRAYQSILNISFDVRGGLVIRQIHHWAALLFVAAVFLHMARVFFTGAFRKPRELNWVIGILILILCFLEGFTGYTMPDDVLSGASVQIARSIMQSMPVIGSWVVFTLFNGPPPGTLLIQRFYVGHVLLLPGLLFALLAVHLALVVRQRHTQPPGTKQRQHWTGQRTFPMYAMGAGGRFFFVFGVLAVLGGIVQINPVWLYGPYEPAMVSAESHPDWYMFFLEGSLRLFPPWEIRAWGHTVPAVFWPGAVLPTIMFVGALTHPFVEARLSGDHRFHSASQRPREAPVRSAVGAAAVTFYAVLAFTAADDVVAHALDVPIEAMVWTLRIATLGLPVVAGLITYRVCRVRLMGTRIRVTPVRTEHFERAPDGGYAKVVEKVADVAEVPVAATAGSDGQPSPGSDVHAREGK